MTDAIVKAEVLPPVQFSPEDKKRATELRKEISSTIIKLRDSYDVFLRGFVHLGALVYELRSKRYFYLMGYQSFGAYMEDLKDAVKREKTQIYVAIGVAEQLLPHMPEDKIEDLGITKASALARMVRITGKAPTPEVIKAGLNMDLPEYRAALEESFHVYDEHPKGKWRELGGFWAEDEEWKTIQQAFNIVAQAEEFKKETSGWHRLKMTILRMAQEIIGTYSGEQKEESHVD
jgi:hypothetical protein